MKMTRPDKDWANRIRRLMADVEVKPGKLAGDLGLARSTVQHWRAGTRIPCRSIQPRLARRLRISVATLNGWAA